MRGIGVASLLLVVLVAVSLPQQSEASWATVVPQLVGKLSTLWGGGSLELLGHPCNYSVKPTLRRKKWKIELYYKGRMWCPGWVSFRGEALTRSRSGVVGKTVTDFVEKAHKAGKITEAQAIEWLKQ